MLKITTAKYEILEKKIKAVPDKCGNWMPTMNEIDKYISNNVDENIPFLIWILETSNKTSDPDKKAVRKKIQNLLYEHIEFVDD